MEWISASRPQVSKARRYRRQSSGSMISPVRLALAAAGASGSGGGTAQLTELQRGEAEHSRYRTVVLS
jgi:hypothetical protein